MKTVSSSNSDFGLNGIIFFIFFAVFTVGGMIYFAANSPWVIQKAAEKFAPRYGISYEALSGNALTGIEIVSPNYQGEPLAEKITLKWNPNALLYKQIAVTKLQIEKANVDTIEKFVSSFESDEPKKDSKPFSFTVAVEDISISLDTFVRHAVAVRDFFVGAQKVVYRQDALDVEDAILSANTNIAKLSLEANFLNQILQIESLSLENVDTEALETIVASMQSAAVENAAAENKNDLESVEMSPFVPKYVKLHQADISLLPRSFESIQIDRFALKGENVVLDTQKLSAEQGILDLNMTANVGDALYRGKIRQNTLMGRLNVMPGAALFDLYKVPFRKEAITNIVMDINISKEEVMADLNTKAIRILDQEEGEMNIDIDALHSHAVYKISSKTLQIDSHLLATTPYAKEVLLTNTLEMDKTIRYGGKIQAKTLTGIDPKLAKLLEHPVLAYEGNISSLQARLESDNIQGDFNLSEFKKGRLHLETKEVLKLSEMLELPSKLQETKGKITVDMPLEFDANATMSGKAKIDSNLVNIDADVLYNKTLQVSMESIIPQDSLLKTYNEAVKWENLSPLKAKVVWDKKTIDAKIDAKTVQADALYTLEDSAVKGKVSLGGMQGTIDGIAQKAFTVDIKAPSLQTLMKDLQSVYTFEEIPAIGGSANLRAEITELKHVDLLVSSPEISYKADSKTTYRLTDIALKSRLETSKIILENYRVTYDNQKFFATKPSTIQIDKETFRIEQLWINDQVKTTGSYNTKTLKGEFATTADSLHVSHETVEFDSKVNLKTSLDGNKTNIAGDITLLGGNVYYDMSQKSFASDEDIIMVQDIKKKKQSPFMDNLSAAIQIKTQKPLVYKQGDIDILIDANLLAYKAEHEPLNLIGTIEIPKGGTYRFEKKKFVFDKSYLYFTGNPGKPMLEAKVNYRALHHLITIAASGSPDAPIINFSSSPSLTKEEILSVILFDSEAGAGTHDGDDMMKMMGGAMAKSVLVNAGVKIDHLVFGEGNSVEVGKRLTDKITIIYVNDEVSSVKLQYRHTPHTESVIEASEISQSYDIIYKTDF